MRIVTIIPLQKGAFIEDLTYFTAKDIGPGEIVSVPLRAKKILGLVVSSDEVSDTKGDIKTMSFDLKKVDDTLGSSAFRPEYLQSAMDCAEYFASKKNDAITALLPQVLRENYDKVAANKNQSLITRNLREGFKEIRAEKLLLQLPLEERISMYKTLIRESFAVKKSIFIVLPNDREVKLFFGQLSRGIENFAFALHPGLPAKKLLEQYGKIMADAHPVLIVGTAQFLAVSRYDIGTIILENESSSGYRMLSRPHFDLRFFAEAFAGSIGARFVLADTMLRFDTVARKETDGLSEMRPLSYRLSFEGGIEISEREKKFAVLTEKNAADIEETIARGKNVFIFSLRKGLATMTVCRDCNEPLMCKNCGAPVVLYLTRDGTKKIFICNRCKTEMESDTICPKCGSWNLMPLGIGTDTVAEAVRKMFPPDKDGAAVPVFQLDRETAGTKTGAEKIVKEFEASGGAILVGTEMALIYLREKVSLSVIASFDSLWSIPNFRMSEKVVQIALSILSKTDRKLAIQTKNEDDAALAALASGNLLSFVREEIEDKERLGYPPFKRFIKITHEGDKEETKAAREALARLFEEYAPEIFSGFVARQKGVYVTNALIKLDPKRWSLPAVTAGAALDGPLLGKLLSLPRAFSVHVDPEDLL